MLHVDEVNRDKRKTRKSDRSLHSQLFKHLKSMFKNNSQNWKRDGCTVEHQSPRRQHFCQVFNIFGVCGINYIGNELPPMELPRDF